jgi:hypothetical protein
LFFLIAVMVPIDMITLTPRAGIRMGTSGGFHSPTGSTALPIGLGIAAGVLVIFLIILYYLLRVKRRREAARADDDIENMKAEKANGDMKNNKKGPIEKVKSFWRKNQSN